MPCGWTSAKTARPPETGGNPWKTRGKAGTAMRVYYDLHIHSCLSPCGDADMTPNNIVNMARLAGLSAIALTDHNACGNCPAILEAARGAGSPSCRGWSSAPRRRPMSSASSPTLEAALAFEARIRPTPAAAQNQPEIFENNLSSTGRIPSPGIRMPSWPGRRGSAWTRPPRWRAPSAGRPSRPISTGRPTASPPRSAISRRWGFRRGGDRHGGIRNGCRTGIRPFAACLCSSIRTPISCTRSKRRARIWIFPATPPERSSRP